MPVLIVNCVREWYEDTYEWRILYEREREYGLRKPQCVCWTFDWFRLKQAQPLILCALPDPTANTLCTTRPNCERYLHHQAQPLPLSALPGLTATTISTTRPNREHYLHYQAQPPTLSALPGPKANIICTTRPNREHYLHYQAQQQTLSALPGPTANTAALPGPIPCLRPVRLGEYHMVQTVGLYLMLVALSVVRSEIFRRR
jgi:hypothetical protein